jgi:hypothetical protein
LVVSAALATAGEKIGPGFLFGNVGIRSETVGLYFMMKSTLTNRSLIAALAVFGAAFAAFAKDQHSKTPEAPAILATMQSELDRAVTGYSKADPPVYFLS